MPDVTCLTPTQNKSLFTYIRLSNISGTFWTGFNYAQTFPHEKEEKRKKGKNKIKLHVDILDLFALAPPLDEWPCLGERLQETGHASLLISFRVLMRLSSSSNLPLVTPRSAKAVNTHNPRR